MVKVELDYHVDINKYRELITSNSLYQINVNKLKKLSAAILQINVALAIKVKGIKKSSNQ